MTIEHHKIKFSFNKAIEALKQETKDYSCYKRELKLYENILKSFDGLTYTTEVEDTKTAQFFNMEFGEISETSKLYYIMVWNVQKALEIIKQKNILPTSYEVEGYRDSLRNVQINPIYAKYHNPAPIIIAKGPHKEDVIIDGNHRTYYAIKNNIKTIPAYVLTMEDSLECIHTHELRAIFKIHKNLMEIAYRIVGDNKKTLSFSEQFEDGKLFPLHSKAISKWWSSVLLFLEI